MAVKGGQKGGMYRPFSDADVQKLDEAVRNLLSESGIRVYSKTTLDVFQKAGLPIEDGNLVKIPKSCLDDCIASAPSKVVLCGRSEENDLTLEASNCYLGTGGTAINVLDLDTGNRRPSLNSDVAMMARVMDALDYISFFVINVFPNDIKGDDHVDINRFYHAFKNTSKHVMGGIYGAQGLRNVVKMAAEIAGSMDALRARPFVSFITLLISPFKIDDIYGEFTAYVAQEGLPVVVPTEPLCGNTSPITMASNVTMHMAETLSGVVQTQLINKGTPTICGSVGTITNLRTMGHLSGAIERAMINSGVSQLAQYYQLPYYSTAGMTDSKTVDAQAGYESGMGSLLTAMSGANYIHDAAGLMEFDLTASYEKLVIDNEILSRTARVLRGIEVDEERIALDLMKEVGPAGHYLGQEHTIDFMYDEFADSDPAACDREYRENWEAQGSRDAFTRAHEKAVQLITEHAPLGIDPAIDAKIRSDFPDIKDVTLYQQQNTPETSCCSN